MRKTIITMLTAIVCVMMASAQDQRIRSCTTVRSFTHILDRSGSMSLTPDSQELTWSERRRDAADGVRTFVGYSPTQELSAIATVVNGQVGGWVTLEGKQYRLESDREGNIDLVERHAPGAHHDCDRCKAMKTEQSSVYTSRAADDDFTSEVAYGSLTFNDGVLRIYRLALPVSYVWFHQYPFRGSIDNVKAYWAETETYLNEYYVPYFGVYFKVVMDEALICTDSSENQMDYYSDPVLSSKSTSVINSLIGSDSYDCGIYISSNTSGVGGSMYMNTVYKPDAKANGISEEYAGTICHELGHGFGSPHTFTTGGTQTMSTEPGLGQSIMSYGAPCNFFSLPSIYQIRRILVGQCSYYTDEERTKLDDDSKYYKNAPYGIRTANRAPTIDRSKLRHSYTIPTGSCFGFHIDATDPDGDEITYAAHERWYIVEN